MPCTARRHAAVPCARQHACTAPAAACTHHPAHDCAARAGGGTQDACTFDFDSMPAVLQLEVISAAREARAAGVSRGWLRLALQSGITLKLDVSLQRSPAAQAFWRAQFSAAGVCMRLRLAGHHGDTEWLFFRAAYPGITHLVGGVHSCNAAWCTTPSKHSLGHLWLVCVPLRRALLTCHK